MTVGEKTDRNQAIWDEWAKGARIVDICKKFNLNWSRIYQILAKNPEYFKCRRRKVTRWALDKHQAIARDLKTMSAAQVAKKYGLGKDSIVKISTKRFQVLEAENPDRITPLLKLWKSGEARVEVARQEETTVAVMNYTERKMDDCKNWPTVRQVAEVHDCAPHMVYEEIRRGKLKAVKTKADHKGAPLLWRIDPESLRDYWEVKRKEQEESAGLGDWLPVEKAAKEAEVSVATIYKAVREKRLNAVNTGGSGHGRILIDPESLKNAEITTIKKISKSRKNPREGYVTVTEAAKILGMHRRTLLEKIYSGHVETLKDVYAGRGRNKFRYLIKEADLSKYARPAKTTPKKQTTAELDDDDDDLDFLSQLEEDFDVAEEKPKDNAPAAPRQIDVYLTNGIIVRVFDRSLTDIVKELQEIPA